MSNREPKYWEITTTTTEKLNLCSSFVQLLFHELLGIKAKSYVHYFSAKLKHTNVGKAKQGLISLSVLF